ncbi:MAG: hypothetical protein JRF49_05725 [Deltaproteobacteria bacterium]|nr:hypothetical protein [Deltaproteobacteria bacterium]MBW2183350.1 hypothetical protein [Deltaproteobacteria bacterium]
MKRRERKSLARSVSIFVVLLFFVAGTIGWAQVQAAAKPNKRPKPPKETFKWGIELPRQIDGMNVFGPETEGDNPLVFVGELPYSLLFVNNYNTPNGPLWRINFRVYQNQDDIFLGFQNVLTIWDVWGDGDISPFHFPVGFDQGPMDFFINQPHPMPGYNGVMMVLYIYEDLDAMAPGQPLVLDNPANRLDFDIYVDMMICQSPINLPWYSWVLLGCWPPVNEGDSSFEIERIGETRWVIRVVEQEFNVRENYQERNITKKGKKERCDEIFYRPYEGTTRLSYEVALVKIPVK